MKQISKIIIFILLFTINSSYANKRYFTSSDPNLNNTDYDTLFKEIFGYEKEKPFKLLVPFFINERQVGKIEVFLKKSGGQIHVRKNELLKKLEVQLKKKAYENIVSQTLKLSTVSIFYLEDNGIYTDYDENNMEFHIIIPPDLRKVQISKLGYSNAPKNMEFAISPNVFSSFLNIRAGQNIQYNNFEIGKIKRDLFSVHIDGAVNINKIVLETVGDYIESDTYKFGKTRLVYDQPQKMLRYYFGDIDIPIIGYQTSPSVGGISITKNFNLQPYSLTKPISKNEIVIYRPSTIKIYSNDVLVEKIKADPGPFNLRQTSFQHGINNVKVKIENDIGEVQEIDIDAFYNEQQLKKGLNQYSFNLGFCSNYNENMYEYDQENPVLSYYYRRGLNNTVTLGTYGQAKLDQFLFGIGSNFSTGMGNVDIDLAFSKTDSVDVDYAGKISYNYFNNSLKLNPYRRLWKVTFEYKGSEFSNLNVLKPTNELLYTLTGFMNQRLSSSMSTSLSASYSIGSDYSEEAYSYSLSLSKGFASNLSISCMVSNMKNIGHENEWRANLNFTFKPIARSIVSILYNTRDNNSKLSWYYNSKNNKVRNDLTTNYSENNPLNFSNRLSYTGYRGDILMNYKLDESTDGVLNNNVNFAGNTSIVFVNGKFGWSKAIRNSFALVKTNDVLKGYKVGIQRRDKGVYQYSSDMFGSAVYTNLTPYRVQQFDIELPDIPVGYEANAGEQILLPTYKSGFLIDVEAKSFIFARGRLVDENNKPLENITAKVIPYGRFHEEEKSIFTNKGGYFYVSGLKPGSYTIEFDSEDYKPVKIKILKNSKQGYCKLGSLKVGETKCFKYNYLKK